MGRSSIKYVDAEYYMYRNKQAVKNPAVSPVIYGRFPSHINKKSPSDKLNKFLSLVLLGLVVLSFVSYYFVSDSEKNMSNIGREIVALSNENIELQNKLDMLHSFNKVETIIQGQTSLDTARRVIEIPAVNVINPSKLNPLPVNYHWSIGY